ncbi:MAG TPA: type IV secretory system conjugative DNA transfer family protein [Acidimicrobiales bacterium]|jgi:type IV secretion system protein VirD4|nr:type IV secretory system conjugative DNA transfer family protein [Acidimicrobiales bacterium]
MTFFSQTSDKQRETRQLRAARATSASASFGVYLGHDADGWQFVAPELSVMILGPPRSGKTSGLIIPNVLAANGPVVSTSTKPDVLDATSAARSQFGRCLLFDPTGSLAPAGDLQPLHWSPLQSSRSWEGAMTAARSLVQVASSGSRGMVRPESSHWNERAQSLLAPLLYAAALDGADMRTVLTWVDRRKSLPAMTILAGTPGGIADLAANALEGLAATDERELSGIWSTASGALTGFRTEHALAVTVDPDFDAHRFAASADTIYICAPAHRQAQVAPLVVGLVEDVRNAAYQRAAGRGHDEPRRAPVLLALDEVANIAPLPQLPSMISEGGGQGVVTLASLQDLSQARQRWPDEAEGFPSLFGCTVVLPGIGDVRTLEALSTLAGDEEIAARSVSTGRAPSGHPVSDMVTGGRHHVGESATTQWRRRLPPDLIARGSPGLALSFDDRNRPSWVRLAPAHGVEPWKTLTEAGRAHRRQPRRLDQGIQR